ncbi:MAG: glycosyltransferase family 2 protein, partial [Cetobacterium sp.]
MISVVIPTYNRKDKLKRALKSVLNQTLKDIEIIIVDN